LGWIEAIRGRLGFLLRPDTMIYGSAGWVGTHVDNLVYNQTLVMAGRNIDGVQLGGGIETAFAGPWSLRFDYQYAKMHSIDLTVPAHVVVSVTAEPSGHVGRLAIIRRFGT
jgi:outer membrane immunogenic protein